MITLGGRSKRPWAIRFSLARRTHALSRELALAQFREIILARRVDLSLTLKPIGFLRTGQQVKFQARHQPVDAAEESHVLELVDGMDLENALRDLAGFSRIWLIWWFHRNTTWRPLVLPPRGPSQRRGVLATRSPHRPNPLGITPVRLLKIEGRTLHLGPCDLVDGTPILDIKPYVPAYDSFPDETAGWIETVDKLMDLPPQFTVQFSTQALAQAEWLRSRWSIDFLPRLGELLARDPSPHRTRRIKHRASGVHEIGCGAWRALFSLVGTVVSVDALETGYPKRFLLRPQPDKIPDHQAQLAFMETWGEGTWATKAEAD